MTVTDLSAEREKRKAHVQGTAVCLGCQHKFQMVKPAGGPEACECPSCGLMKAVFIGLIMPEENALHWVCNCGSIRFIALTGGNDLALFCEVCGTEHLASELPTR